MAADKGMITLVVLLDYSGAYDTVDHSVMLEVLDQRFGVRGNMSKWHQSYLHGRMCSVVADGLTSRSVNLDCSLLQSSSLGLLKYVLYASGVYELTGRFGIKMLSFANNTQPSMHLLVEDIDSVKRDMAAAIAAISSWSRSYRLKLNAEKSEVMWLGTLKAV